MTKTLVKHGNSLALIIDKPILDLLDIDSETPLDIHNNGTDLIIRPQRTPERQKKIQAALDKITKQYDYDLKKLA